MFTVNPISASPPVATATAGSSRQMPMAPNVTVQQHQQQVRSPIVTRTSGMDNMWLLDTRVLCLQ